MIEFNFFSFAEFFFFSEQRYSNSSQSSSMPGIEKRKQQDNVLKSLWGSERLL